MNKSRKKMLLESLNNEIMNCRKCRLREKRTKAVPGEGKPDAEIMFIGEAPGRQEDIQGRPFVGAAGRLLDSLIESILGIKRTDVFITNVVKCRPPNNRDPLPDEILACSPYLDKQISIIEPKIIVCLGRHSARYILARGGIKVKSILSVRGRTFNIRVNQHNITVIPTIHPAAALYRPPWKKMLEEDFKKIRDLLSLGREKITIDSFF